MTHLPTILCTVVPQKAQRYDTVGDWPPEVGGVQQFVVSKTEFFDELATLIHEIVEWAWCKENGITAKQVDEWDMGPGKLLEDPGSHDDCPYRDGHDIATSIVTGLFQMFGKL